MSNQTSVPNYIVPPWSELVAKARVVVDQPYETRHKTPRELALVILSADAEMQRRAVCE